MVDTQASLEVSLQSGAKENSQGGPGQRQKSNVAVVLNAGNQKRIRDRVEKEGHFIQELQSSGKRGELKSSPSEPCAD